mmetsp:Transcript_3134/g.6621  ORF Transcript_3134/g.6621 Transcript_3134/m.6621 type:complete len:233 (-) Transcript_3134:35-733(-)
MISNTTRSCPSPVTDLVMLFWAISFTAPLRTAHSYFPRSATTVLLCHNPFANDLKPDFGAASPSSCEPAHSEPSMLLSPQFEPPKSDGLRAKAAEIVEAFRFKTCFGASPSLEPENLLDMDIVPRFISPGPGAPASAFLAAAAAASASDFRLASATAFRLALSFSALPLSLGTYLVRIGFCSKAFFKARCFRSSKESRSPPSPYDSSEPLRGLLTYEELSWLRALCCCSCMP